MRQDEPVHAGFLGDLPTLTRMQMNRIGLAGRKRAVQHGQIGIAAKPHETFTIL